MQNFSYVFRIQRFAINDKIIDLICISLRNFYYFLGTRQRKSGSNALKGVARFVSRLSGST